MTFIYVDFRNIIFQLASKTLNLIRQPATAVRRGAQELSHFNADIRGKSRKISMKQLCMDSRACSVRDTYLGENLETFTKLGPVPSRALERKLLLAMYSHRNWLFLAVDTNRSSTRRTCADLRPQQNPVRLAALASGLTIKQWCKGGARSK